jgi:hypothetical protein
VLIAVALAVGLLVVVPPARLQSNSLESVLSTRFGFPVQAGSAQWLFDPWPGIELRQAVALPRGPGDWPIGLTARRVVFRGLSPLAEFGPGGTEEVSLAGVALRYGPLRLREARIQLLKRTDTLRIRGRALGTRGGSMEVRGELGTGRPASEPLRVYLAALGIPLVDLLGIGPGPEWGNALFTGVMTVVGSPELGQKIQLNLEADAPREDGGGNWLESTIQGGWRLREGRFVSGEKVRIHGRVRDLGLGHELRVVHGGINLALELAGDVESGGVVVDADFEELHWRAGDWFEKNTDSPASLHYEFRWTPDGQQSGLGVFRLGSLRLRMNRLGPEGQGWEMRSTTIPLEELREYVPALRDLPVAIEGKMAVEARWSPEEGIAGKAVLQDARVTGGSEPLEIPLARLDLWPDALHMEAPELLIADQSVGVTGLLEWIPSPGRSRIGVAIQADHLDLEPLLAAASSLWNIGGTVEDGSAVSWSDAAEACVRRLRMDPQLLKRLQIGPATLEVDHLAGLGIDMNNARFRLKLFDQLLELEQSRPGNARRYAVDLQRWFPKLTESY